MNIAVCIPSIGRKTIIQTVQSVLRQETRHGAKAKVIIADDSRDKLATKVITDNFKDDVLNGNIIIVESNKQNIAEARNMCLQVVGDADYVGFIDDDEYAAENWIDAYLDEFGQSGCDVLFGKVVAVYDKDVPPYFRVSGLYCFSPEEYQGRFVTGGAGNVMMKRQVLNGHGVKFLKELGITGGEDTIFFYTLYRLGAKIDGASEAIVYEKVSLARCDLEYLKKRFIRTGQTQSMMQTMDNSGFDKFAYMVRAIVRLAVLLPLCTTTQLFAKRRYVD